MPLPHSWFTVTLSVPVAPVPATPVSITCEEETSLPISPVPATPDVPVTLICTLPLPDTPNPSVAPVPATPVSVTFNSSASVPT